MCGIIGFLGQKKSDVFLSVLKSLQYLEYRGYDSFGIAYINDKKLSIYRSLDSIENFINEYIDKQAPLSHVFIAHTRWATHGAVNIANTHPILSFQERFVMVHNGTISNYLDLRQTLNNQQDLRSQTDTEVLLNFIIENYHINMQSTLKHCLKQVNGRFSFIILDKEENKLFLVCCGLSLVVARQKDNYYVASDLNAIINQVEEYAYLNDGDIIELTPEYINVDNFILNTVTPLEYHHVDKRQNIDTSKGKYAHYMLKEMWEQRELIPYLIAKYHYHDFSFLKPATVARLQKSREVFFIACGSSYYACLSVKYFWESFLRIRCHVEIASEFNVRDVPIYDNDVFILVSQSGETADILTVQKQIKTYNAYSIAISNYANNALVHNSDDYILIHAGIERGVAASKTFTATVVTLQLWALSYIKNSTLSIPHIIQDFDFQLSHIDVYLKQYLSISETIKDRIPHMQTFESMMFLGRHYNYALSQEALLKMQEIAYVMSDAYSLGEMKHGPIALINDTLLCVILAFDSHLEEKILINLSELKTRNAHCLIFCTENSMISKLYPEEVICFPKLPNYWMGIMLNIIPCQFLAYYFAHYRSLAIDKPRNLAKSVTVE